MSLKLGIPSKGRLQADTISWFEERGIRLVRSQDGREYAGRVEGLDGVELVMLSAGEVPRELAAGRLDLAVTGRDMVREKMLGWVDQVHEITPMGFGFADLIVAVPKIWVDVETIDDLDAAAAAFRAEHGFRLRIATKYHNLVRGFLTEQGLADYQLVDSQGATEGTIRNLTAEAVADITTSGDTLRANHLKILSDGLILKSEAVLFGLKQVSEDKAEALSGLMERLG